MNFRTGGLALTAARALALELKTLCPAALVVVENHSEDGSRELLGTELPRIPGPVPSRLLVSKSNRGYGSGNNLALRLALSGPDVPEYCYLMNPDALPDAGAVAALVDHMDQHPRVAIAGSCIHNGNGTIQLGAFRFPSILGELERGLRLGIVTRALNSFAPAISPPSRPVRVDWVSGASMLLRTAALRELGVFDEQFFLYFEETDLCRRARRRGWLVHCVPKSTVAHVGAVATGLGDRTRRVPSYWFNSRFRYLRKHHGILYGLLASLVWVAAFATWRLRRRLQRRPDPDPPGILRDALLHLMRGL